MVEMFLSFTNRIGNVLFMREINRLRALNNLLMAKMDRHNMWREGLYTEPAYPLTDEEKEICALTGMSQAAYIAQKERAALEIDAGRRSRKEWADKLWRQKEAG